MFARFAKILVVLALVFSTGLHWAALQTVAWGTMLAANLTTGSFEEAVSDTFDGEHPCPMCKAIESGKKSEKQSDQLTLKIKFEFPPAAEKLVLVAPRLFKSFASQKISADSFSIRPVLPPPRSFFV